MRLGVSVAQRTVVEAREEHAQSTSRPRERQYAGDMARGWESKAVESQQDDARHKGRSGPALSAEDLERRQKADAITLALADTTAQLQAACRPLHRDMLRQRIAALEALLAEVTARRGPVEG